MMIRIVLIAALAVLSAAAFADTPDETLVLQPLPHGTPWKSIMDKSDALMVMREWIPADQNEADIKDIITEQHFAKFPQTPAAFVKTMIQRVYTACTSLRANGPIEQSENGYAVAYAQLYCAGQKGANKDVDIYLKAIAGKSTFYVVQYEVRRAMSKSGVGGVVEFSGDQLEQAKAHMARQGAANTWLSHTVQLCPVIDGKTACPPPKPQGAAPATTTPAAPDKPKMASDDDPGPNDLSKVFGWTPGKTTSDEVEAKFGEPMMRRPGPDGHYTFVYQFKNGSILVCLFKKDKVLVRMIGYQRN